MNALKAEPRAVDLRAQAPYFYGLAVRMLELMEEEELVEVLMRVRMTGVLGGCCGCR